MIERYSISRDPTYYHAFPDLALTPRGRLVCVYLRCRHHTDRSHTQILIQHSDDQGQTWSPPRPVAPAHDWSDGQQWFWNCPRIVTLPTGELVVLCDRHPPGSDTAAPVFLWFSTDEGESWAGPHATPAVGIVPDRLQVLRHGLHAGRWVLAAHRRNAQDLWEVRCWWSDDVGRSWQGPGMVACVPALKLCEPSVFELPTGELVALLRENSGEGLDAYKALSTDGGTSWGAVTRFPLPGCHRPVGGILASGRVLVGYRFTQGGRGNLGKTFQNFFVALTDVESCLSTERKHCLTRIAPVDFDRSAYCDTGYCGWVQLPDGVVVLVNYILDDWPRGQIRAYRLRESDLLRA